MKKTLISIVLAGALAFGVSGCSKTHTIYHYDGKIGEEQVRFYEEGAGSCNILEVIRTDGTVVKYSDLLDDFKLDFIDITKDGETIRYSDDVIGQDVLEEGQSQFEGYLAKIPKLKQTKGLMDIKKE